jgi:hypothetical protein
MSAYKPREELDAMLIKLQCDLPAMIQACKGTENFDMCVFEGEADAIMDSASPSDREYVHEKIQCLLGAVGLIPSDNEGQSCMSDGSDESSATQ